MQKKHVRRKKSDGTELGEKAPNTQGKNGNITSFYQRKEKGYREGGSEESIKSSFMRQQRWELLRREQPQRWFQQQRRQQGQQESTQQPAEPRSGTPGRCGRPESIYSKPCRRSSTGHRWEQCSHGRCDPKDGQLCYSGRPSHETGYTHELAAGIALHSLSLAVTSEVVGSTALVAGGSARVATESTAETTGEPSTGSTSATWRSTRSRDRAVALGKVSDTPYVTAPHSQGSTYGKVTRLAAVVAAAVRATIEAQCGTVGLDVAKSLTVVALLG